MNTGLLKFGLIILTLAFFNSANAQSKKNYKYQYKEKCNCIVSKNNPAGIEKITVGVYTTDPDVHQLVGYYNKLAKGKVDTFHLDTFSPKDFQCYPCVTLMPSTNYVFYFPGKDDMDEVPLMLSTDANKVIKENK
jgi:hypothetical protein